MSGEENENGKREREKAAHAELEERRPLKSQKNGNESEKEGDEPNRQTSESVENQDEKEEKDNGEDKEEQEASPVKTAEAQADETNENNTDNVDPVFVVDRTGEVKEAPAPAPAASGDPRLSAAAPPAAAAATTTPPAAVVTGGVDPTVQATIVNTEQMVEERGEIPAIFVGKVIGKGGEMIRDLQARSGARIDVEQHVPIGMPRGITYRGTRKTVDFAKHLVMMLQQEHVSENDLPLGDAQRRYVIIPALTVGKVIGRGGEMIRELQNKSHAKIQIDHAGASGIPPDQKQVSITGTEQAVVKAVEMINFLAANPHTEGLQAISMLVEEKLRSGGQWGSGPPYPGLPNQGINMQPEMLGQPQQSPYGGGGAYGGGGGYPAPQQPPYGGAPPFAYGGAAVPPQQLPGVFNAAPVAGGAQEVDVVYAQKQYMGRIIGKKGITINDLQRRSGTDIQVNQDVAAGQECEITVRGSRQGIDMVKQMIREIVEVGPQHPYAGGADSYGGGGGYQQQSYGQSHSQQVSYGQQAYGGYQAQPAYGQQQSSYQQPGGYQQQQGGYAGGQQMQASYQVQQAHQPSYGQQQQASTYYGGGGYGQAAAPPVSTSEWKSATSPDGQVYYYNERTGVTQWDKPAGMP